MRSRPLEGLAIRDAGEGKIDLDLVGDDGVGIGTGTTVVPAVDRGRSVRGRGIGWPSTRNGKLNPGLWSIYMMASLAPSNLPVNFSTVGGLPTFFSMACLQDRVSAACLREVVPKDRPSKPDPDSRLLGCEGLADGVNGAELLVVRDV